MGYAAPPLVGFFQQLKDKNQKILIPGAGNAWEAEWLWRNGFTNLAVVDIAAAPLENLQRRLPEIPDRCLRQEDFFDIAEEFDLMVEQTFFCALPPERRSDYVKQSVNVLKKGGSLMGVLFQFPLGPGGPPFGGSKEEYMALFSPYFKIWRMENCYNSIKPRLGNELFIHLIKP